MVPNYIYMIIFVIVFLIVVIILFKNRPTLIDDAYNTASRETRFSPTYFLIYDNSTENNCDRLIVVEPFSWMIWATNNRVFIVEDAPGYNCPAGSTAAIRVTRNIFTMDVECIRITPSALLNLYKDPVKVPYDITNSSVPDKFTVLDALNILFTKYITMGDTEDIDDENDLLKDIQNDPIMIDIQDAIVDKSLKRKIKLKNKIKRKIKKYDEECDDVDDELSIVNEKNNSVMYASSVIKYDADSLMGLDELYQSSNIKQNRKRRDIDTVYETNNLEHKKKKYFNEKIKSINNVKRLFYSHYQILKPEIQSEIFNRLYNNNSINQKYLK
ncbi:PIF-4 [Tipula oleracea nudivirus]|uniref:PIF-4 n=1 Tax=Tipula oleracea nudivirus TaxID=1546257 RepID=A0A0B4VFY4_9VIRU|nr:PIF-4 [Tipula oleracea nudivirus]AJD20179.1 PIF-4 [Tipula oleracea nudivirus]